jgi:molecular chaperone Hsp33
MASIYSAPDEVRRFTVENRPVRGQWVRIESAWRALREHKHYPPAVRELLGQAVSASVLLAATLKFKGTLTFQIQGSGAVRLLVSQCTHDFRVRAVARLDDAQFEPDAPILKDALTPEAFRHLVGTDGRVAVTVEAMERGTQYQGIVPLVGDSLAECLETYFDSSEQLPTRVRLAADDQFTTPSRAAKMSVPIGITKSMACWLAGSVCVFVSGNACDTRIDVDSAYGSRYG